eukprot:gene58018-79471_t
MPSPSAQPYRLRIIWPNDGNADGEGIEQITEDPYTYPLLLGEVDLYLFNEGRHWELGQQFGSQTVLIDEVPGARFAVKETSDRLAAELEKRGIRIAARIDHAAAAKAVGLDMPPTEVILFGNPRLGTPLMLAQPSVAIELPMKMLVWQDATGKVTIGYTPPSALKERHQITGQDEPLTAMAGALGRAFGRGGRSFGGHGIPRRQGVREVADKVARRRVRPSKARVSQVRRSAPLQAVYRSSGRAAGR